MSTLPNKRKEFAAIDSGKVDKYYEAFKKLLEKLIKKNKEKWWYNFWFLWADLKLNNIDTTLINERDWIIKMEDDTFNIVEEYCKYKIMAEEKLKKNNNYKGIGVFFPKL